MNALRRYVWIGVAAIGVVLLVLGTFYIAKGIDAKNQIRAGLIEEQIKTGKDGVQFGVAEGTLITDAKTAKAQADIIELHTLGRWGPYSQMAKNDPNRATYVNGVALRTALNLAVMGFGLADFAIGTGIIMILLGTLTVAVGVPVTMYTVRTAEHEALEGARQGIPAQATS